jgi:hypothetical protein
MMHNPQLRASDKVLLAISAAVCLVLGGVAFRKAYEHDVALGAMEPATVLFGILASGVWSLLATTMMFSIPARIVLNIMAGIRDRRRASWAAISPCWCDD